MLNRTVTITANGDKRRILKIWESSKGDVYIRLFCGLQIGMPPDNLKIKQYKYSLHVSKNSTTYNTIKKQMELEDGTEKTCSSLTDAVKTRSGFSPVFNARMPDLSHDMYDYESDDKFENIDLGEYLPSNRTFVIGVFVGSRRKMFCGPSQHIIREVKSTHFKIVLVSCLIRLPSITYSHILDWVTFPPESASNQEDETLFRSALRGKSDKECLVFFGYCFRHHLREMLKILISYAVSDATRATLRGLVDQIPEWDVRLIS